MPRGGARPGAGRPRKNALYPEFRKLIKEPDAEQEQSAADAAEAASTAQEQCEQPGDNRFETAKVKAEDLPPLANHKASEVITVSNERAELTKAQIRMLLQSPHVSNVTRKTVSYTLAFKEMFWRRYCEGEPPETIFAANGIDPDVLGNTRVWGLVKTLRSVLSRGLPMTEGRQPAQSELSNDEPEVPKPPRSRQSTEPPLGFVTVADIRKLYHQVAYLTQEMDFLKKVMLLEKDEKSK